MTTATTSRPIRLRRSATLDLFHAGAPQDSGRAEEQDEDQEHESYRVAPHRESGSAYIGLGNSHHQAAKRRARDIADPAQDGGYERLQPEQDSRLRQHGHV